MNKDIKKLWVEALESGEYEQGKQKLRTSDNKFCCLGVLCNLHAQAHPEIAEKETNPLIYMDSTALPHRDIMRWAGLSDNHANRIVIEGESNFLYVHNDNGRTFKQIAKAIKEQL